MTDMSGLGTGRAYHAMIPDGGLVQYHDTRYLSEGDEVTSNKYSHYLPHLLGSAKASLRRTLRAFLCSPFLYTELNVKNLCK